MKKLIVAIILSGVLNGFSQASFAAGRHVIMDSVHDKANDRRICKKR